MKKLIALGSLALLAGPAFSQDADSRWYIAPKLGYTFADSDRNVDDAFASGLSFGKHLNDAWALELNVLRGGHDGDGAPDLDLSAFSADVLRSFNGAGRVSPYLTAGVGALRNDPDLGAKRDDFMVQAGAGLLFRAWENADGSSAFNIRPEVKLRWDDAGGAGKLRDVIAAVAFEFAFGAPTVRAATPEPVAPPQVASAPVPAPVVAAPQPVDSDGDGVFDEQDRCPVTPRGTAVDEFGCPRKGTITLVGVNFENNSAKLVSQSLAMLDAVAADLVKYPSLKVEVQGHTDSVGSDAYNLKLSQGRADSVRDYLVARGVAVAQLAARGYGESRPVADNTTAEGRAQNRRVAMDVLDNPGDVQVNKAEEAR